MREGMSMIATEREQDRQDRKRQDGQDSKNRMIILIFYFYYPAHPAACDPAYPVPFLLQSCLSLHASFRMFSASFWVIPLTLRISSTLAAFEH